jgi:hypothetical protein
LALAVVRKGFSKTSDFVETLKTLSLDDDIETSKELIEVKIN